MNLEKIIDIAMFLVIVAIIILGIKAVANGLKLSEKNECVKWVKQSEEINIWYSTPWQKEQCKNYGIALK